MRRLFHTLRTLLWLPFFLGGHPVLLPVGLIGAWLLASAPGGGGFYGWIVYALMFMMVNRALYFVGVWLFPGQMKRRPAKAAKPIPVAVARAAGTVMKSPPAEHSFYYLPPVLQQFLREEAAVAAGGSNG